MLSRLTLLALLSLALSISFAGAAMGADFPTLKISSETHPSGTWVKATTGKFTWEEVQGAAKYRHEVANTETPIEGQWKDAATTSVTVFNLPEGENYFILEACDASGSCSGTTAYKFMLDRTGPGPVEDVFGSGKEDGIHLSWKEPQDVSGISEYNIYRSLKQYINQKEFGPTDLGVRKILGVNGASYVDTDKLSLGVAYYYRVQAIDGAGNQGSISPVKRVLNTAKDCTAKVEFGLPKLAAAGNFKFKISSDTDMDNASLEITLPDNQPGATFDGERYGKEINADYDVPENFYGTATATLTLKDADGSDCEYAQDFEIDSVKPTIKIVSPENMADASGKAKITAIAGDLGSGISNVELFVAEVSKGGMVFKGQNENGQAAYESEIDTANLQSSIIQLKVIATDKAGNSAEDSLSVQNANGQAPAPEKPDTGKPMPETPKPGQPPSQQAGEENYNEAIILFVAILVACLMAWALLVGKKEEGKKPTHREEKKQPDHKPFSTSNEKHGAKANVQEHPKWAKKHK